MQQLTGLDAAFLAMETRTTYGHVGSVILLDAANADERLTLDRLIEHTEARLHLLPPYRRRLMRVPLDLDQPYWIDDEDFDIEFHVRELALPKPGNDAQLADQVARLHARPLDRSRPLWETYLIHGLSGGRLAVYTKIHHSAIDGVSGNEILTALLDVSADGREVGEPGEWNPEHRPSKVGLLARSALSLSAQPVRAVRFAGALVKSLPSLATTPGRPRVPVIDRFVLDQVAPREGSEVLQRSGLRAPKTPFNRPITSHRRWGFASVSLDDVRAVRKAFPGMTVNDVAMAMCAGALRRYLLDHDELPDEPLVSAVPVSVRSEEESAALGNRVSMMFAPLPTTEPDPAKRLYATHESMRGAKEQHQALPADLLADVTQFAMPAVAARAAQLAARLRIVERVNPFNLIISNVPGPNIKLYLAGTPLLATYPVSAIAEGQGLNITLLGYLGQLHFGLLACRELVPDVDLLVGYLVDELEALVKLSSQSSTNAAVQSGASS
jgi:diacylglycerol O-acyltransferase / wax synthase